MRYNAVAKCEKEANLVQFKECFAVICTFFAISLCGGLSTNAEPVQKKAVTTNSKQRVGIARPRPRVIVRNRSFLDPGTKSLPGASHEMEYAVPGASPLNVIVNTPAYHRGPLPGPFDLPSRNNPWPWWW